MDINKVGFSSLPLLKLIPQQVWPNFLHRMGGGQKQHRKMLNTSGVRGADSACTFSNDYVIIIGYNNDIIIPYFLIEEQTISSYQWILDNEIDKFAKKLIFYTSINLTVIFTIQKLKWVIWFCINLVKTIFLKLNEVEFHI